MLFQVTYVILKEAITKILGEEPDQKLIDEIISEIKKIYHEDLHVHHFHLHNYINHRELTFHIRLDDFLTVGAAHKIAYEIEKKVEEKFEMTSTIHVEPMEPVTP
jgi:divalent metal cation (Fe/Co/Zn/Cd) transporter